MRLFTLLREMKELFQSRSPHSSPYFPFQPQLTSSFKSPYSLPLPTLLFIVSLARNSQLVKNFYKYDHKYNFDKAMNHFI